MRRRAQFLKDQGADGWSQNTRKDPFRLLAQPHEPLARYGLARQIIFPEKKTLAAQPLRGLTFVLTGELADFTRDEAKAIIKQKGGVVSSSVSNQTDYVVAGANPGSKYANAKKWGVKILDEKEFKKIL